VNGSKVSEMEGQGRQPINGHALQDYHTQLMILGQVRRERERELSRQTAAASPTRESEITETSESSSPGTLAEHSDDAHVRSLKRRRSNDTETRSNQSGTFFAYIPSGESSNYNGLSAVQISNTEVGVCLGHILSTDHALIIAGNSCHLTLI
jgi:hypothetical protein